MPLPPGYVDDGDFSTPQQNGAPEYSFPFAYRGDNRTFVAKVMYRVDVDHYNTPEPMAQKWFPGLGKGYMVDFDQPSMVGQRLLEYGLYFASVPITGTELGTVNYTFYTRAVVPEYGVDASFTSYNDTFDADYVYEYSINQPLPQLYYARFILQPYDPPTANFSAIFLIGTVGLVGTDPNGASKFLAQNSTSKIYKGGIYERLSIYAKVNLQESTPRIYVVPQGGP